MSVFTNPASASAEEAAAYIDAILELLGDREPTTVLRATPSALRNAAEGLSSAQLARPEKPGKWSIRHVLQHLADSELVWGWRLRRVLARDRPRLTGFDQDRWADRLGYDQTDATHALDEFSAFRASNLRLLERMAPADLERVGVHAERGEETVAHMMRLYAGHDLVHRRQIERIRSAVVS
ncbi:MAG: DinB family protein [Gemmatimonadota bacterium]